MMNAPVDISSLAPVVHRSAWMSGQMKDASKWLVRLPQVVLDELMAEATRMDRASLVSISTHVVDAARLPRAAAALAEIEHEIMTGLGFALIKGLDPELDDGMLKACYWVMLNLMGKPISQNSYGDLLTDVMDTGKKLGGARVRGYQTNANLKFHTDRASLVTLLCVRGARSGGYSRIASAISVFNELLAQRPDVARVLFHGLNFMSIEEGGEQTITRIPIYNLHEHVLSVRYSRNSMATAILNGAPFTDVEKEALEVVDRLAEDPRLCLDMTFERGDIQAVNNFTTLHARTEFEDYDEPHLKRRLTRGWLATNTRRAVGAHFHDYFGVPTTLKRQSD
jgi:hypothetical protein